MKRVRWLLATVSLAIIAAVMYRYAKDVVEEAEAQEKPPQGF